jgi:hypothetical protein
VRFLHVCLPGQPAYGAVGEEGKKGTGEEKELVQNSMFGFRNKHHNILAE